MASSLGMDVGATTSLVRYFVWGTVVFLGTVTAYYIRRGYQVRQMFQELKRQGIPIMPHSPVLGHLEVVGKLMSSIPSDAHGDYMQVQILRNWKTLFPECKSRPPVAYVDVWPFSGPMVIILDPEIAAQGIQDHSLPKAYQQKHILYPLTRGRDLSSMEGAEFKVWRKRLNPGFSIQHITSRVPEFVDEVEGFVDSLKARAGKNGAWGSVFQLEEQTTNLALNVILRYFFQDTRFHGQGDERSVLSSTIIDTLGRVRFYVNIGNFLWYYSPWNQFKMWNNYRITNNELAPTFRERVAHFHQEGSKKTGYKSLVDLIVQSYAEITEAQGKPFVADADFVEMATGQIATFMFAGHDTTAATVCWVLYTLYVQHPEVLQRMREEHDAVLGPDAAKAGALLRESPNVLNSLPYTSAVLREILRVHANVGSMRRGEPGFYFVGPPGSSMEGMQLPTDGFIVWDGTLGIHRDPAVWARADEFLPERFLTTDESDPLHPPKNAWRFFEHGPRGCIGQHLATIEMKLVMVMVARTLDIECAWQEWDSKKNFKGKPQTVDGDRMYQAAYGEGPPHPKDRMPVHVRVRHTA